MESNINADYSIQTFDLTKKFGKRVAVNGLNLAVKKGEMFSLLGQNGAGKTTTIKMLSCLLKPTDGSALIMGKDIKNESDAVKQIINVSPQETAVAGHLTSLENLLLMGGIYGLNKAESKNRADDLIQLFGLKERTKDQVNRLSGGLQRRLSIAMAMISDPKILFLDEPTLGLDPQARKELWDQIEKLKGKKTIILTTHYLEEADALSDRIAIIKSGELIALGTPGELKNDLSGMQTMVIKAGNLTRDSIASLKTIYPNVNIIDKGIEVIAGKLVFDEIVDCLRAKGVKIEWVTMKEPSLDDVYLSLTGQEVLK